MTSIIVFYCSSIACCHWGNTSWFFFLILRRRLSTSSLVVSMEVDDNRLNTKVLANELFDTNEICQAWRIWLRHSLRFEVVAKDASIDMILTLHLLVPDWVSTTLLVEQQIVNLHSLGFWTPSNLWTSFIVNFCPSVVRDYIGTEALHIYSTCALVSKVTLGFTVT